MFNPLNLGALVVSAIRTAVTDPALVENVAALRSGIDKAALELVGMQAAIENNQKMDVEQADILAGIVAELNGLADALTGPVDDSANLGLAGEVQPVAPPTPPVAEGEEVVENIAG